MKRNNDEGEGGETNIENKTQQLPHELITEILLRLPVKSLVRFNCVCNSWLSLISDSRFATSHFDLTTNARTHKLVLITNRTHEPRSIDFQALLNHDTAIASLKLDFLLPQYNLFLEIGGSCRGFLFLHCGHSLYLWNPSTGIYKHLPRSPIVSNVEIRFFTDLYGFGYDPSTDDYLVILGSSNTTVTDDLIHLEFFSLRANTWKEIEFEGHLPYMSSSDNSRVGTLFNGAIHWLAYRVNISVNVIVAFDLTKRTISEISLPDDSDFYPNPYTNLTDCDLWVFRGFMSLWNMENGALEIWVMKEYGVNSSWTKTLVLRIGYFSPICSTDCGDIVGSDDNICLIKYNDNGRVLEHRLCCYHPHGSQVALYRVYSESLLPLPLPDTQQP